MAIIYYYDACDSYGEPRYKHELFDGQLTKHWLHDFKLSDCYWLIPGTWKE